MIVELLESHDNIIYLCSHDEWKTFLESKLDDTSIADHNEHVAHSKWRSLDSTKQVSHTWYYKCYNTKLNRTRPTLLLVGKGFEFEEDSIRNLSYALHPKTGVIVYA